MLILWGKGGQALRKWVKGYGYMEFEDRTRYFGGYRLPHNAPVCAQRTVTKIGWWLFVGCAIHPDPFCTCPLLLHLRACPKTSNKEVYVWLTPGKD